MRAVQGVVYGQRKVVLLIQKGLQMLPCNHSTSTPQSPKMANAVACMRDFTDSSNMSEPLATAHLSIHLEMHFYNNDGLDRLRHNGTLIKV